MNGSTVVITGGCGGIGIEIIKSFLEENVAVSDFRIAKKSNSILIIILSHLENRNTGYNRKQKSNCRIKIKVSQ